VHCSSNCKPCGYSSNSSSSSSSNSTEARSGPTKLFLPNHGWTARCGVEYALYFVLYSRLSLCNLFNSGSVIRVWMIVPRSCQAHGMELLEFGM